MACSKNGYLDKAGQVKWRRRPSQTEGGLLNWPKDMAVPVSRRTRNTSRCRNGGRGNVGRRSHGGIKMVAPVIMAFGNEAQKKKYLPPILFADVW